MFNNLLYKRNVNILIFESLHDLLTNLLELPENNKRKIPSGRWTGRTFINWNEIANAMQSPWSDGRKAYDSMINELHDAKIPPPQSLKRKPAWSEEEGDEFSWDRYQGDQPFLRTTKRKKQHTVSTVTIVNNVGINSGVDSINLVWRAAATVYLTELLEQAGYRVELWAGGYDTSVFYPVSGIGAHENILFGANLKRCEDPIDCMTLLNTLSGWAYRTIFLGAFHLWGDPKLRITSNYGYPETIGDVRLREITTDPKAIECNQILSKEAAVQWIKNQIELFTKDQ